MSVHLYPERGKVKEALETLEGFSVGKPVVIEETFPLSCSIEELEQFIEESRGVASGWIGFYWGQTPGRVAPAEDDFRCHDAGMVGVLPASRQGGRALVRRETTNSYLHRRTPCWACRGLGAVSRSVGIPEYTTDR